MNVPSSAFRVPRVPDDAPGAGSDRPDAPRGTRNAEPGTLFPRPRTLWQAIQAPVTWLAIALVRLYQLGISPGLPSSCRFAPSCSQYMLEALQRHHALKGLLLGTWRLMRCHPFHPGGVDPVP